MWRATLLAVLSLVVAGCPWWMPFRVSMTADAGTAKKTITYLWPSKNLRAVIELRGFIPDRGWGIAVGLEVDNREEQSFEFAWNKAEINIAESLTFHPREAKIMGKSSPGITRFPAGTKTRLWIEFKEEARLQERFASEYLKLNLGDIVGGRDSATCKIPIVYGYPVDRAEWEKFRASVSHPHT